MKNRILHLILAACLLGSLTLSAQVKKANIFFEQYKYSKAIPLYKKDTNSKDEKIRKEAILRLADCYRLINNAREASAWYTKAVAFDGVAPESYYYLGMSLRSLARYDEAEKAFSSYASKNPSDFRGKIYEQYCRDIKKWEGLTPSAEIRNASGINSIYSDFGPVYFKNTLLFSSDRDLDMLADKNYLWTSFGYLDLYSSHPLADGDFWSTLTSPVKMPNTFNQAYHDGPASFTSNFKEIFTTRTLKNSTKEDSSSFKTDLLKIYFADLSDPKKVSYKAFPFNSDDYSVGHPAISADGKKLIFSSNMPGGIGQCDLFVSELVNGQWSKPVNLGGELNTFGNEVFPFLANDSTLFFASDGHPGFGGLDIYETKLVNGKWTTPWNLKLPINSAYDDFSITFNKNLTDGFFSSNRPGGKGSDDIYAFRNYKRTPAVEEEPVMPETKPLIPEPVLATICGYVKDKKTKAPLDSATIFLLNSKTNEVLVLRTDSKGYFESPVDKGGHYIVKGMKASFFDDCMSFTVPDDKTALASKISHDLYLDKYGLNQVFKIENIYYDLNKWLIREDAKPSLDKLIRILKQYPINVELGSHTDCRASSAYNNTLSQKRAEAAVNYIIENGIGAQRLTYKGYGETQLINKCADGISCTEAEHQANRRTEFKITSINAPVSSSGSVDLNLFKAGDKFPAGKLNSDFFKDCVELNNGLGNAIFAPNPAPNKQINSTSDKIAFAVQVAAATYSIKIIPRDLKSRLVIHEKKMGRVYRYFSGDFENIAKATDEKQRLQPKFPGAFIVAFKSGQPISMNQALKN